MLSIEKASAHLRGEVAGEVVALHARWQTARSDLQLARVQVAFVSEIEAEFGKEVSGRSLVMSNRSAVGSI